MEFSHEGQSLGQISIEVRYTGTHTHLLQVIAVLHVFILLHDLTFSFYGNVFKQYPFCNANNEAQSLINLIVIQRVMSKDNSKLCMFVYWRERDSGRDEQCGH